LSASLEFQNKKKALPLGEEFVRGVGVHQLYNKIYTERRGWHYFLAKCFCIFDVAIWTCAPKALTEAMVQNIFKKEELSKIKFVMHQSFCTDSGVLRPDGKSNVMLKDLTMVWHRFYNGLYDATNTIVIDDSPTQTFLNPTFMALYPKIFKYADFMDTFLGDILWPFLEKLSQAVDVRLFLEINTPKWSSKNYDLDQIYHDGIHTILQTKFAVSSALHTYDP